MGYRSVECRIIIGLVLIVAAAFPPIARASDMIAPGFDLFDPLLGSVIFVQGPGFDRLVPITGVPLGTFDFPGFGGRATGNTDSIVQRLGSLSRSSPTTGIQMLAMQFMSVDGSNLFFTLNNSNVGAMEIIDFGAEPHSSSSFTWSNFNVAFDVRPGSLTAPPTALLSAATSLTVSPSPWTHEPGGAFRIDCINLNLPCPTGEGSADFFPIGQFTATGANGSSFIFQTAVPEPETLTLLCIGGAGIAVFRRKLRQS